MGVYGNGGGSSGGSSIIHKSGDLRRRTEWNVYFYGVFTSQTRRLTRQTAVEDLKRSSAPLPPRELGTPRVPMESQPLRGTSSSQNHLPTAQKTSFLATTDDDDDEQEEEGLAVLCLHNQNRKSKRNGSIPSKYWSNLSLSLSMTHFQSADAPMLIEFHRPTNPSMALTPPQSSSSAIHTA